MVTCPHANTAVQHVLCQSPPAGTHVRRYPMQLLFFPFHMFNILSSFRDPNQRTIRMMPPEDPSLDIAWDMPAQQHTNTFARRANQELVVNVQVETKTLHSSLVIPSLNFASARP